MIEDAGKFSRLYATLARESERDNAAASVIGETVTIGNNNFIVIKKIYNQHEITPAQKQRLSELVGSIVGVAAAQGNPVPYQKVWARFQRHFHVNSYHVLTPDQFSSAEAFLKMLYARAKRGENLNVHGSS